MTSNTREELQMAEDEYLYLLEFDITKPLGSVIASGRWGGIPLEYNDKYKAELEKAKRKVDFWREKLRDETDRITALGRLRPLIPHTQIRKNLIQGSALLEAWNIEPTELAKEVDTGEISSGKLVPYDSKGNIYPLRPGEADANYDAALKAWFRLEDVLGLFSIERLSPEDRATVIDYLPERNSSLTAKKWVSWSELVRVQPPFQIFKAMRDGSLKPLHSQTGAAVSLPLDLLEYFAILKNTENPEKDKEVMRRLAELVDIEPLLNDLPPDKLNEECSRLENAVFSASEVDQVFSREASGAARAKTARASDKPDDKLIQAAKELLPKIEELWSLILEGDDNPLKLRTADDLMNVGVDILVDDPIKWLPIKEEHLEAPSLYNTAPDRAGPIFKRNLLRVVLESQGLSVRNAKQLLKDVKTSQ